ncbi:MAG: Mov34/MPN/PAD-1 family protein [bacterium]|nr:Mov34/MPN/PAD-1 family protein [bacterium]
MKDKELYEVILLDQALVEPLKKKDIFTTEKCKATSYGEPEKGEIKIYFKEVVFKEIENYAQKDTTVELGGVLLGEYFEEKEEKFIQIIDCIEAKHAQSNITSITFTHQSWEEIYKELEKREYQRIIGWYHTHPNFDITLSDMDIFIQKNFFNLYYQVAYVVDPIKNKRGFFQIKDNKVIKFPGFYVYAPIKIGSIADKHR